MGLFCPAVPVAGTAGLDSFTRTESYQNGMFADVPTNAWYAENVAAAYELGLMKGSSSTQFSPLDNLTVAEMLTIACRIHAIYYTGKAEFPQSTPWYQVYVDYDTENGLIAPGQFADLEANAIRAQFATVMANAVPAEALTAINTIPEGQIPDVPAGSLGYDAIYCLYRASVLVGNDAAGTFTPNASIQRNAVTAVYWQNSIQAPNIFEFRADGTVVHYFMEPGQSIWPETLGMYRTGRYQLNGNKLTLTWGDWSQTLEMVTPESLKAKGDMESLVGKQITVSGEVIFGHTAYHLTAIVLMNSTVG